MKSDNTSPVEINLTERECALPPDVPADEIQTEAAKTNVLQFLPPAPKNEDQSLGVETIQQSEESDPSIAPSQPLRPAVVPALLPPCKTENEQLPSEAENSLAKQTIVGANPAKTISEPIETVRLSDLKDDHLEKYAENYRLVLKIEETDNVRQAAREIKYSKCYRTACAVWKRYQEDKRKGLVDQRWYRRTPVRVLTEPVKNAILSVYYSREGAGPRMVWKLASELCKKNKLPVPAETTVKNYLANLSKGEKLARQGARGMEKWNKQYAPRNKQKKSTFANELWQGDHTRLKIWIRRKIRGKWTAVPVFASALIDDFSRAVPNVYVSHKYSDSWSIAILYRQAMMQKDDPDLNVFGKPMKIESDRGADWISEAVRTSLQALGINHIIDKPRRPHIKGKIERFFRHMNTNLLSGLPGFKKAVGKTREAAQKRVHEFLTLEQLRDEIKRWLIEYHNKEHSKTKRTPLELWRETVRIRPVENEDDFHLLLLKFDEKRTVTNTGITFTPGQRKQPGRTAHSYWSPALTSMAGRRVRLRYNPEDAVSVIVVCADTGKFICEAWDLSSKRSPYTYADVNAARKAEAARVRGVAKRCKAYFDEVTADDRRVETRKEFQKINLSTSKPSAPTAAEQEQERKKAADLEMIKQIWGRKDLKK